MLRRVRMLFNPLLSRAVGRARRRDSIPGGCPNDTPWWKRGKVNTLAMAGLTIITATKSYAKHFTCVPLFLVSVTVVLGSGGVIYVISTNRVSNEAVTGYRWEPSGAAGATWAHSWATYPSGNTGAVTSYVSGWTGSSWNGPTTLTAPNGLATGDVNLSWDPIRSRFVFALLDLGAGNLNIWYGYSTDSTGSSWVFGNNFGSGPQPIFSAVTADWDYPSIGVDASGRVIVGAVDFPCNTCSANGYYAAISGDGEHFSAGVRVGGELGPQSRVAATSDHFEAFIANLSSAPPFTLNRVNRYESYDGVSWSGPFLLENFDPPLNSYQPSGLSYPIFYAPLLSAAGYTDGRWIVGFQRNVTGFNNVEVCTSDRGCGTANLAADDQVLAGVSASADGYWVAYHAYSTLSTRQLPLITQALYFPTGAGGVGATTNTGIDPSSWAIAGLPFQNPPPRCTTGPCYASGDFNTPASNPYASSSTAFVQQSSRIDDLFQSFAQDPPQGANVPNFKPNFIPHAVGANLVGEGLPVPPTSYALPPQLARGLIRRGLSAH